MAERFIPAAECADWFRALPVEALAGSAVDALTVTAAFRACFRAALNGGAYGQSPGAAYARLYAWDTFAWLAGAAPDADRDAAAVRVERCRWYSFGGDWFENIAGDLGLICVRPDGMSAAVLAATDAD